MLETIPLTGNMIFVLSLVGFTTLLSFLNILRVDVIALLVLVLLGLSRLLPAQALFSGFSSDAVISLICIMIISTALEKTGIASKVARGILKLGREHPDRIQWVLMGVSSLLSAFMRSLGTVALLLPVVARITMRTGISKSRFLMPVAFCAVLGSSLTMIGSSALILLNSLLREAHLPESLPPFKLFSVFPVGLSLVGMGCLYFALTGRRFLSSEQTQTTNSGTTKTHFLQTYGKGGEVFELKVPFDSVFVGLNLTEIESCLPASCSLLAVRHAEALHFPPLRNLILEKNAAIAIMGEKSILPAFATQYGLTLEPRLKVFSELLHPSRSGLCEAVVPPSSQLIGRAFNELHMKRTHQIHLLAVYRGSTLYQGEALKALLIRSGDTLGMFCLWEALIDFNQDPDFAVITTTYPREKSRPHKMGVALFFLMLSVGLIVWGDFSVPVGLLLGAAGMIGGGVLSIDEAYESVSWKTAFLVAGFIPLGTVMHTTETAHWLTQHFDWLSQMRSPYGVQLGLAVFSTLLGWAISNVGATIVLVPVALKLAHILGADPRVFALIVALSASNSFLLPNQQVNALIAGPGGYRDRDFILLGGGMTVLYWFTLLGAVNFFF